MAAHVCTRCSILTSAARPFMMYTDRGKQAGWLCEYCQKALGSLVQYPALPKTGDVYTIPKTGARIEIIDVDLPPAGYSETDLDAWQIAYRGGDGIERCRPWRAVNSLLRENGYTQEAKE